MSARMAATIARVAWLLASRTSPPAHPEQRAGPRRRGIAQRYLTLVASRNVPETGAGQDGATPDRLDIRPVPLYFEPHISGDAAAQDKAIAG